MEKRIKNWKQYLVESNDITSVEIDSIFNDIKKYLSENNKTENKYHNNKHILDVFNNSMMLFNEYFEEYNLTSYDKLCLGIAALFHDFGHSGGKLTDIENIEIALDELKKYLIIIDKENLYNDIREILYVTEFPHKDLELNMLQKIIRDADTMGGVIEGWMSVVEALAGEYNKTLEEFIPTQIKFLENAKYNTDYCNKLLEKNRDGIIEKLNELLNSF